MKVPQYEQTQSLRPLPQNNLGVSAGPDAFGASIAGGIDDIGKLAASIDQKRQEASDWELTNDLQNIRMGVAKEKTELDIGVKNGEYNSIQAQDEWEKRRSAIFQNRPQFPNARPESIQRYQVAVSLLEQESNISMLPLFDAAADRDNALVFSSANTNAEKQMSELSPDKTERLIDAYTNSNEFNAAGVRVYGSKWNDYKTQFKSGVAVKNAWHVMQGETTLEGLDKLYGDVSEDKLSFKNLTADNKIDVLGSISRKRGQLENQIKQEQEKRNTEAENWLKGYEGNIFSSLLLEPSYVESGRQLTKGTPFEQEFNFLSGIEKAVPAFNALSITAQGQHISEMNNSLRNTPSATASEDRRRFEFFEKLYGYNKKMYKNSPMEYNAMRSGTQLKQIQNMNIFLGDASQFTGTLRERFTLSNEKQVFTDTEIADYKNKSLNWTDDQHVKAFGNISAVFGNTPNGYAIAMDQLSNGDNALLGAGMVYKTKTTIDKSTGATSEVVAKQILEGNRLIKNKQITMPDNKDFESAFNSTYASVYNSPTMGKSMQAHLESAKALYASWAATEGKQETEIDNKLFAKAMRYTGGEPIKINGSNVMVPLGMDADDVKNRIVYTLNSYAQNGIMPDKYKNDFGTHSLNSKYSTIQSGEGKYILTYLGKPVPSTKGGFVEVNIYKPAPTPNSGIIKGVNVNNKNNQMRNVRFGQ